MALPAEETRYTFADALTWGEKERIEIIDGEAFMMAPPLRVRQKILRVLFMQIANFLDGKRCEVYLTTPRFIVGIGGSATNDGGIGMLQALGYGMLNANGNQVAYGAKGLEELAEITDTHVLPELKECTFRIACDVTNPLCGDHGASAIYGPQKGAAPTMILQMDKA